MSFVEVSSRSCGGVCSEAGPRFAGRPAYRGGPAGSILAVCWKLAVHAGFLLLGAWRRPVARLNGVQEVPGSNPGAPIGTTYYRNKRCAVFALAVCLLGGVGSGVTLPLWMPASHSLGPSSCTANSVESSGC